MVRGTFPVNVSLDEVAEQVTPRARAPAAVSRGRGDRPGHRPAGRRHRPDRLLQRRDLRPPAAAGRVAGRSRAGPAADQGRAGQGTERRARRAFPRRRTGTSRRSSATTSWRRSPGSRARTRSRSSAPTWTSWKPPLVRHSRHAGHRRRRRKRRRLSHPGAVEPGVPGRPARSAPRWNVRRRTCRPSSRRPSAARRCTADSRASKYVRSDGPLARATAVGRAGDPEHPGGGLGKRRDRE